MWCEEYVHFNRRSPACVTYALHVSWWFHHSHLQKTEWFPCRMSLKMYTPPPPPPPPPLMPEKLLLYLTATVWQREDVKLFSSLCSSLKCNDIFHLHRSHSHSQDIALNIYLLLHMEGTFQTVIMCVRLTVQLEICVVFVESMPALRLVPSHSSPVARGTHKVLWVSLSSSCLQWVPLPLLVMV